MILHGSCVSLCPWLHFRPKHPLKGFLNISGCSLSSQGPLVHEYWGQEPVPRSNLGSWLLIWSLLPGTWCQDSWPPSHFVGRGQGTPSSPLAFCTPVSSSLLASFLERCLLPVLLPSCLFWWKNLILIPSLSTSDLPALRDSSVYMSPLNLNGQSRTPATDHLDFVGLSTRPKQGQAELELTEIARGKCPTVGVRGNCWWPLCPPKAQRKCPLRVKPAQVTPERPNPVSYILHVMLVSILHAQ